MQIKLTGIFVIRLVLHTKWVQNTILSFTHLYMIKINNLIKLYPKTFLVCFELFVYGVKKSKKYKKKQRDQTLAFEVQLHPFISQSRLVLLSPTWPSHLQLNPLPSLQWSLFLDKNNISQIIRDKSFHQWLSLNHDSYDNNTSNLLWLYSLVSNYLSQIM